jgi:cyclophilin family peptidyl-prolyl cis-trans isomerase
VTSLFILNCSGDKSETENKNASPKEETNVSNIEEVVVMETTLGTIVIDLYENEAPIHSANFKKLVTEKQIVGTYFHRVIPGFVVQGGDPNTLDGDRRNDGMGGVPGERITAEIGMKHLRGCLGAARDNNPEKNSSTSQFYFCLEDLPQLDSGYTVFAKVIKGMDVVDAIAKGKTDPNDNPVESIYIKSAKLVPKSELN